MIYYKWFTYAMHAFSTLRKVQQIDDLTQNEGYSKEQRGCFFLFCCGMFHGGYEIYLASC